MSNVGINLAAVNYWGSQYPFIDRIKASGWWTAVDTAKKSTTLTDMDANGYPSKLPSGTSYIYTSVALDPVELSMTDRYVITYKGAATITPTNAKIISSEPGRIVFEATKDRIQLKVSGLDSSKPLADLSLVREDQVAAFKQGEIFNPDFVSKIDAFSTLRFMDWGRTNGSPLTSWSERPTMADRSWAGSEGGVPIEVMVALANKTGNDMWINIPAHADDNYVRQTLQYVKQHLNSGLKVKVEYSNEMWNFMFEQTKYAAEQGDKLFGKDVNGDGKIDPNDAKEHVGDGYLQYYGYRAAQIASIGNSVFGTQADDRLENVLAGRGLNATKSILEGVNKAKVGSVATLFDTYAVATYFAGFGDGTKADMSILLGWARSGAAGINAAFNEMLHGGKLSQTQTLDKMATNLKAIGDLVAQLGLNLVAYEGGASMTANRADTADQADLIDFYNRLLSDPRMGDLYRKMQAAFSAAGGAELNVFNDSGSSDNKYGQWGALASIYDKGSVRYDTLISLAEEGSKSINPALAIKTSNAVTTLSAQQTDMTFAGKGFTTITGNAASNRLVAGNDGSKLYGLAGDDRLIGGAGADYLDGGTGADTMTGGAGNDIYIVDNVGDKVIEVANGGTDEVRTTLAKYNLGVNVEDLTFTGTGDFAGTGNELNNVIRGGAGNDTLSGGLGNDTLYGGDGNDKFTDAGGADTMVGGRGDDLYYVDNVGDRVIEAANEGNDTVYSSVDFSIAGQSIETLKASGTGKINLTGNEFDNFIVGNDAANVIRGGGGTDSLRGMGGNDTIYGDVGNDVIDGGTGNDLLYGRGGNDRIVGGDGDDVIVGGSGADGLTGGAGNDTFVYQALSDLGKTRETSDVIFDFSKGDKIDFSRMDANTKTTADDAFTFIGSANFSKHAGELRVTSYAGRWDITGDVNGDGVADFILTVNKASAFHATDFIL